MTITTRIVSIVRVVTPIFGKTSKSCRKYRLPQHSAKTPQTLQRQFVPANNSMSKDSNVKVLSSASSPQADSDNPMANTANNYLLDGIIKFVKHLIWGKKDQNTKQMVNKSGKADLENEKPKMEPLNNTKVSFCDYINQWILNVLNLDVLVRMSQRKSVKSGKQHD